MSTAMGPYSPVVAAGSWLICSGQLGLAPPPEPPLPGPSPAPVFVEGGTAAQLTEALANAEVLLRGHGATRADVVKTTVFLTDMGDAPAVNQVYTAFFGDHRPARSMVAVAALPLGALVEVEVWAYREST